MLGLVYIIICFLTGYVVCNVAFPKLNQLTLRSYQGSSLHLSPYFVILPAWFLTGTLCVTWVTYIIAYLFGEKQTPLLYANAIAMPLFTVIFVIFRYIQIKKKSNRIIKINMKQVLGQLSKGEWILLFLVTLLAALLMWLTFFMKGDKLYVGISVFGDFSPHIGMVRSFSKGNNFPTQYSHFAGQDIRYHFMFQFLVGNLEFLGFRLDYAFNIPSIISFVSAFLMLYVLTVKITGRKAAGYLACLFFAFRSSSSLFTYLSEIPKGTNILNALNQNTDFIGYTTNENWGLWNLNVYCNQRHFAFSIAVIILIIMMFLPYLYEMLDILNEKQHYFTTVFFSRQAWTTANIRLAVAGGILLGSIAFWNGAALIAALVILFVTAIFSSNKLDLLIMAVIAFVLSELQAKFFIHGSVVTPQFYFGFLAQNKTLFGVGTFIMKLWGILPIVLFAAFLKYKGVNRYIMAAFTALLVFAFSVSLTTDINVNHKYIMIAIMFLGIYAADFVVWLYDKKDVWIRFACVILVIGLTATGIYDFTTVLRKNQSSSAIVLNLQDELTEWIEEHSDSKDIFLTSNYSLNRVVMGGAMLFQGWQYFAWSAGYDTYGRDEQVKLMYEAETPETLDALVKQNHIRFIVVDYDNRHSDAYQLNEDNIKNTYVCVYQDGEGDLATYVFDTTQLLQQK